MTGQASTANPAGPVPSDVDQAPLASLRTLDQLLEMARQSNAPPPMPGAEPKAPVPEPLQARQAPPREHPTAAGSPPVGAYAVAGADKRTPPAGQDRYAGGPSNAEQSIDEYMAQLLERLRAPAAPKAGAAGASPRSREERRDDSPRAGGHQSGAGQTTASGPAHASPIRNRGKVPSRPSPAESTASMKAMRELAIENARSALEAHVRRRLLPSIYCKLFAAVAAMLSSCVLIAGAFAQGPNCRFGAAAMCLIIALYFSLQYFHLTKALVLLETDSANSARGPVPVKT